MSLIPRFSLATTFIGVLAFVVCSCSSNRQNSGYGYSGKESRPVYYGNRPSNGYAQSRPSYSQQGYSNYSAPPQQSYQAPAQPSRSNYYPQQQGYGQSYPQQNQAPQNYNYPPPTTAYAPQSQGYPTRY